VGLESVGLRASAMSAMSVGTGLGDSERKLENIFPRCIYETRYMHMYCMYISITPIRKGCTSCVRRLGWVYLCNYDHTYCNTLLRT